ncbi:MAG: SBBP repeat-containing protein, partial [Planctomycetes bacterium]|nr:SBBP repeat-containing protein [Planctomycetota bacterium]
PVAWQERDGERVPVAAAFRVLGRDAAGFEVSGHDPALPLVIDPEIVYSTYLGAGNVDVIEDMAVDGAGRTCVTGRTSSTNFPVLGAYQPTKSGNDDGFVTVFAADGKSLAYSTHFGGNTDDNSLTLAVDGEDRITVGGWTQSTFFPTRAAVQGGNAGGKDGFVARFAADGASLVFSTFLGGSVVDLVTGVAVDASGAVFVAGETNSSANFPVTTSCFQGTLAGNYDAFLCKLSADGTTKAWCTFLGGSYADQYCSLVVDGEGRPVVLGTTYSTDFPVESPFQEESGGEGDVFLACFSADGSSLAWSSYFGGENDEYSYDIAVAPSGALWITGATFSGALPVHGAFQSQGGGNQDGFVARVASDGSALQMATYLGGALTETPDAIAVDSQGSAVVAGFTDSTDFPTASPLQAAKSGLFDGFVTMFKSGSAAPVFSTYLGGNGDDRLQAVAFDPQGRILAGGFTNNGTTYPVKDAYQAAPSGAYDGILTCILRLPPAPTGLAVKLVALRA